MILISCLKIDAGGFTTNVSSELCPQESKPEARRPCTKPCDGQCVVSEWTEWLGCPRVRIFKELSSFARKSEIGSTISF